MNKIHLAPQTKSVCQREKTLRENLVELLSQDLDFHAQDSGYASHNFHSFPAKFPPQLPRKFIKGLTSPGEMILDPMVGSGTTVLEAYLTGRRGIGFDIDPLALLLTKVKVTPLEKRKIVRFGKRILTRTEYLVQAEHKKLKETLHQRWDSKTREFVNYWFSAQTQIELLALIQEIGKIEDMSIRAFFELVFSAIIITKSGGVSLAFDLAHTRPHRAKIIIDQTGQVIEGKDFEKKASRRIKYLTKTLRSAIKEFEKRLDQNLTGLFENDSVRIQPYLTGLFDPEPTRLEPYFSMGNAQNMPLEENSMDLIVTSPPYASNAIDYMRAHKFSLVWLGYPISNLGQKRKEYIGGESVMGFEFEELPGKTQAIVDDVARRDEKKGRVLHRYYSEMTRTLREMYRVLKPGKAAIVVVGNSTMRGKDTETQNCLAELGRKVGFEVPKIGVRNLDRNRRMMPAGFKVDHDSQIQQRMHQEYVIGFHKPPIEEEA